MDEHDYGPLDTWELQQRRRAWDEAFAQPRPPRSTWKVITDWWNDEVVVPFTCRATLTVCRLIGHKPFEPFGDGRFEVLLGIPPFDNETEEDHVCPRCLRSRTELDR